MKGAIDKAKKEQDIKTPVLRSSDKVDTAYEYVSYRSLATLPPGVRRLVEQSGAKVRLIHEGDEEAGSFEVGGKTFNRTGVANWVTKECKNWTTYPGGRPRGLKDVSDTVAHEVGHFAMGALMTIVAKGRDDIEYHREKTWAASRANDESSRVAHRVEREKHEALYEAVREFDRLSLKEGVTTYADSYAKDPARGHRSDVWEYRGEVRSENPATGYKGSSTGPRAAISRAGNENFAEMTSMVVSAAHYPDAKAQLEESQKEHPAVWKQYKVLWNRLKENGKLPEGVWV
jgi:hypothetical protein